MTDADTPFHPGEIQAQRRAGAHDVAKWAGGFIRDRMPDQHRAFFAQLPFVVLAGADADGRHWVTLMDGPDGFAHSPDARTLTLDTGRDKGNDTGTDTGLDAQDPLAAAIAAGTDVGMLGIDLANRRRNRLNGAIRATPGGFAIDVHQSFGNCPQYIHERNWHRVPDTKPGPARRTETLTQGQIARIAAADTLFLGTGRHGARAHPSGGFDASHRGGAPGFVQVIDPFHLRLPDYPGNNFFNTIGNLLENPAIALVFVDFDTGGLLHLTGQAHVAWDARDDTDPAALRMIDIRIDHVIERPGALSLRWSRGTLPPHRLRIVDRVAASPDITSFHLAAADGAPLPAFVPGQHLPVELDIPGQPGTVRRSYSLSGAPGRDTYRISVKREPRGIASRHLHDTAQVGDMLAARAPSGDFTLPEGSDPLVLVGAGVGLTPMLAMLHATAIEPAPRQVHYVHGARRGADHPMQAEVDTLVDAHAHLHQHVFYSRPDTTDRAHIPGRITAPALRALGAGPRAHYMLCGPAQFLADLRTGLEAQGVPDSHIHFETSGPTGR